MMWRNVLVLAVGHGSPRQVVPRLHVHHVAIAHVAAHHVWLLLREVGTHLAKHVLLLSLPDSRLLLFPRQYAVGVTMRVDERPLT